MDGRLRAAVDASVGWYGEVLALHGTGSVLADGLWSSTAPPPPLHSDAVVVEPGVSAGRIAERLAGRGSAAVKDSFATLDLSEAGMRELFSATWLHAPAPPAAAAPPPGWGAVTTPAELAEWTAGHDTAGVLLPGLLQRAHVAVLARRDEGRIAAGAVARLAGGVVEVSNAHAAPGGELRWPELVAAVAARFPGRPLTGYERGADLGAALAAGFSAVGELRVWVR